MKTKDETPDVGKTMVNPYPPAFEVAPPRPMRAIPEELAEDIEAKPLTLPDFANDIQPYLVNQGLAVRWIFTDRRRYAQARAQGWRNCSKHDLKPSFANLSPFEEEGGTKYINGDLILMVIDRKRYVGALRYKHAQAEKLSRPAVQKKLSVDRATADMGDVVNAINRQRASMGQPPLMEAFSPYFNNEAGEVAATELDRDVAREASRLGHEGPPDIQKKGG